MAASVPYMGGNDMVGYNNYYTGTLGQMQEPVNTEFEPHNYNPRIPFWRNIFAQIQPSTVYYKKWGQDYRQTQRNLMLRTVGVTDRPTSHSYQQLPAYRTIWHGKLMHSGLGTFAQPVRYYGED